MSPAPLSRFWDCGSTAWSLGWRPSEGCERSPSPRVSLGFAARRFSPSPSPRPRSQRGWELPAGEHWKYSVSCATNDFLSKLRHQAQSERFGYKEVKSRVVFCVYPQRFGAERAVVLKGDARRLNLHGVSAKLEAAKTQESLGVRVVGPILRRVMAPIYIFAATHVVERPWTNARSQSVAQELLASLVQAAGCGSVAEFLRGKSEDEEGRFAAVMELLKQELTKDTWKRNPATKFVFSWTLPHVSRPWLSHYLERVLPPSLLISDDYREENKILGVRCLHHIILNVPAADLCQFNRAQVVYHALYNHLYSREAPLIQAVLLCLLDLLPILERAWRQQKQARPAAPCDEVLQLVLTHMEAEHRLALRRGEARAVATCVRRGLGYLEVCDGPEEEARLGILETLQCTIEHAWPRMPCRLPVLLKALLKMIWDVHTDQGSTPEPVKATLLQGATECLILLDRCSEGQVKVLLEGVYSSCEENRVRECIRKVQEST
nr:PREDICTED: TELO2-interacting protein 2 [Opisthocomus hoazin]